MSLNSLSCDPSFQNLSFFQPFPAGAKEWWWWYLTSTSTVKLVTFRLSLLSVCLQVSDTFICFYVTASVNKKKSNFFCCCCRSPKQAAHSGEVQIDDEAIPHHPTLPHLVWLHSTLHASLVLEKTGQSSLTAIITEQHFIIFEGIISLKKGIVLENNPKFQLRFLSHTL